MSDVINFDLAQKHIQLFKPFFDNEKLLNDFIWDILKFEDDLSIRRMMNTVQRLVTLSDEISIVKKGSRDLSIFFLVTCIEAINNYIPKQQPQLKKQEIVIDFFDKYLTEHDKSIIESSIKITFETTISVPRNISISEFSLLLVSIRNTVAHEGLYWNVHFKEEDGDCDIINIIESKLKKDEGTNEITYFIGLKYSDFRTICIKAFLSYIDHYFKIIKKNAKE